MRAMLYQERLFMARPCSRVRPAVAHVFRRAVAFISVLCAMGCGERAEREDPAKDKWLAARKAEEHRELAVHLEGDRYLRFDDGWYPEEHDRDGGGAWRWMGRRGIVRMRLRGPAMDLKMSVFGWVPYDDMFDARTLHMQFEVNGHVVDTFIPPHGTFQHDVIIPRALIGDGPEFDVAIDVANVVRPRGDWRELGFATTGIFLAPVGPP